MSEALQLCQHLNDGPPMDLIVQLYVNSLAIFSCVSSDATLDPYALQAVGCLGSTLPKKQALEWLPMRCVMALIGANKAFVGSFTGAGVRGRLPVDIIGEAIVLKQP